MDANAGTLPEIHRVAAGRGSAWWSTGWHLFKASPGLWILIVLAWVVISTVLANFGGNIGNALSTVATPIFAAGVMFGARDVDAGNPLRFEHLFAGFKGGHFVPLLQLGLINLAFTFLVIVAVGMLATSFVGISTVMQFMTADSMDLVGIDLSELLPLILVVLPLLAVGLLLVGIGMWFAPALVALQQVPPWTAFKLSFAAIWRNAGAMIVFDLVLLMWGIAATIPLGLGWIVLAPTLATAWYASWRELFTDNVLPSTTP
jgi:uncharacterized membrane protein